MKTKRLSETKVEEVLSEKPSMLQSQDSVEHAGEHMRSIPASNWPVVDEKKLVGVVNEPEPDRKAARFGHDPKITTVGEQMSRDVAYCYEDQSCEEALAIMDSRSLEYLPVIDRRERITGILRRDELIARCTLREPEEAPK
jgi:predicted transcriptional regulator